MMNSLPRWLGRKKPRDEKKSPIEISEPFGPVSHHGSGLSSLSSVSQSLASLNSLGEDNDALYVNGRVPRGQFREYFLRPDTEADHRFLVPAVPRARVGRAPSLRSGPPAAAPAPSATPASATAGAPQRTRTRTAAARSPRSSTGTCPTRTRASFRWIRTLSRSVTFWHFTTYL